MVKLTVFSLLNRSQSCLVTVHLPGSHRLVRALSDLCLEKHRYRSLHDQLRSLSETAIDSHRPRQLAMCSNYRPSQCFQRAPRFQYLVELQSSNTCFEGSTEFTPDFLPTAMSNSKYDDEHTEQFGFDSDQPKYLNDNLPSISDDKEEKLETLTFDSIDQESDDSLNFPSYAVERQCSSGADRDSLHEPENDYVMSNYSSADQVNTIVCHDINRWKLLILPTRTDSVDSLYEKRKGLMRLKSRSTDFYSPIHRSMIGKRVRLKRIRTSFSSNYKYSIDDYEDVHVMLRLCVCRF